MRVSHLNAGRKDSATGLCVGTEGHRLDRERKLGQSFKVGFGNAERIQAFAQAGPREPDGPSVMTADEPRRRRFKISLRLAMVLVFFVALWMARQANKAREQREAVEAVKQYGGWVHYDYEFVNGTLIPGRQPRVPAALRRLVGDEFFQDFAQVSFVYDDSTGKRYDIANHTPADDVLAKLTRLSGLRVLLLQGTQATDEGLKHIGRISSLEELFIWDAENVSDAGVAYLEKLKNLKNIHLSKAKITDESLRVLARLPRIETLSLQQNHFSDDGLAYLRATPSLKRLYVGIGENKITDEGMTHLSSLPNLELIDIQNSKVTDRGLEYLKNLPKLREIWAGSTQITAEGEKRIKEAIPTLKINR